MRFESIDLYNFKNYKGKNSVTFSKKHKKDKNIFLIGGLNGAGKTTLLEAIKLCLYGKKYNGKFVSKNEYNDFIYSAINRKAVKENNLKCFIELKVIFDDSYPTFTLNIKRSWHTNNQKEIEESFEVFRDDAPLEFISKEYWQDYINYLIPSHVSEFFFFNGEKVKELAVGSNADEILQSSIKDLIGLNLYEKLLDDLQKLKSKIRRRNEKKGHISQNINEHEALKTKKTGEIKKLNRIINTKKKRIKENNRMISEIEKELKRKAGAFAELKKEAEKQILKLQEKNAILNEQITNITKDLIPFLIPLKLSKKLFQQLEFEQNYKNLQYTQRILKGQIKEFSKNLKEKSKVLKQLSKQDMKAFEKEINTIFSDSLKNKKQALITVIHDLTISDFENIKMFLQQINKNTISNFENTLETRQNNSLQINKIKKELKTIPDDFYVITNLEKTNKIKLANESLSKEILNLTEETPILCNEIEKINLEIEKLEEEIICVGEDNQKIAYINRIISAINEYNKEMITLNTKNLENTISTMYHSLANKEDMVKEIKVNPLTFTTELFDFDGNSLNKEGISEGEKEIYAISVLWGLSTISHHKLPMIIDTPLSKLDNTHVKNITSKFFPKASDQVILLSQDREIDQNIYSILKPHINQSYTLLQKDENKIKSGYFFN